MVWSGVGRGCFAIDGACLCVMRHCKDFCFRIEIPDATTQDVLFGHNFTLMCLILQDLCHSPTRSSGYTFYLFVSLRPVRVNSCW